MATDEVVAVSEETPLLTNPWPWFVAGLAGTILGWLVTELGEAWNGLGLSLLVAGMVAGGGGVAIQPSSAVGLAVAALVALLGGLGFHQAGWDSVEVAFMQVCTLLSVRSVLQPEPAAKGETVEVPRSVVVPSRDVSRGYRRLREQHRW